MTTWALIVDKQALNVITGDDLQEELQHRFVEGYDFGHPGIEWSMVPDGTQSGATENQDGTVTNPAAPASPPRMLTKLEFVILCQTAGGMTDANLVAAKADSNLAALWIKLEMASSVERDNPNTDAGLGALAALGYLPNGKAAVISAWPTS